MLNQQQTQNINDLIKITIKLVYLYTEALKYIKYPIVYDNLYLFQKRHQNHISILQVLIFTRGKVPNELEISLSMKTSATQCLTELDGIHDAVHALKVVENNEEEHLKKYFQILLDQDMPDEAKKILHENYYIQKIHLGYIRDVIRSIASLN